MKGAISKLKDTIRNMRISIKTWKRNSAEYHTRARRAEDALAKTKRLRDSWKTRYKNAQNEIQSLRQENRRLKSSLRTPQDDKASLPPL